MNETGRKINKPEEENEKWGKKNPEENRRNRKKLLECNETGLEWLLVVPTIHALVRLPNNLMQ